MSESDIKRPTRWSYSSVSTYEECPSKWKYSYIDNLPWPSSAAMARGTRMHTMAEDYVKGNINFCPPEIKKIGPLMEQLKARKAKTEEVWLLDKTWTPTEDPAQAWVKAIIDVHHIEGDTLYVKDYKSGRMYDSHRGQLELYGIMGLLRYPEVTRVATSAVYMDDGFEGMDGSIIRAMLPKMIPVWEEKAQRMMADDTWEPRPSSACRWCSYKKENGGPCPY